jgi:capsular polysaccharide transport system permease protein|nr:ABC transporter permease [Neorhizobium tomejilense]
MYHLRTHCRVVAALLVREMSTRFGGKPGGYIWALLEPAAYVGLLTIVFSGVSHAPALGTSFPLFFATGFLAFQFYAATASYVMSAVASNKAMLQYPNVAPFDTVVARFLLQLATMTIVATVVLTAIEEASLGEIRVDLVHVINAIAAASLLGLGISLVNIVLFIRYRLYESIYGILAKPLFLVTGVFYIPEMLPAPIRNILLLNPLVHVVAEFRKGFYPEYRALGLDMNYAYGFGLMLFMTGLTLFTLGNKLLRQR